MKKNSLVAAFNVEKKKNKAIFSLSDYEIFKDKDLLDNLRKKIVESLIDKNIPTNRNITDFINDEIENACVGYDLSNLERSYLFNLIDNEINGFGPLTELLDDSAISKIMVNAPDSVFIEIDGVLSKDESVSFINEDHIYRTINRLLNNVGKSVSSSNPIVDTRLEDGTRVNVVIPPLSICPVITIHKFMKNITTIDDMIRTGSCTPYMARFLEAAVNAKLNIIICGVTSSGKTTLLNILGNFINNCERIVTIEESRELKLTQENVISLESRNDSYNKNDNITSRELLINALRMRPDRLVIGEIKGPEAFEILQAMNTGYEGSISTIHATSSKDALSKLETMALMNCNDLPLNAVREYICSAVDIIINIERLTDGKKKITNICEVVGIKDEKIAVNNIFDFKQKGLVNNGEVDGEYILYDKIPRVYKKMKKRGIDSLDDIFVGDVKLPKSK